jgi:hypothetical protein
MPASGSEDENGIPAPSSKGLLGKARVRANRAFAETVVLETNGHGHADGHEEIEAGDEHPVGAGQLPAGDAAEEDTGSPAL